MGRARAMGVDGESGAAASAGSASAGSAAAVGGAAVGGVAGGGVAGAWVAAAGVMLVWMLSKSAGSSHSDSSPERSPSDSESKWIWRAEWFRLRDFVNSQRHRGQFQMG